MSGQCTVFYYKLQRVLPSQALAAVSAGVATGDGEALRLTVAINKQELIKPMPLHPTQDNDSPTIHMARMAATTGSNRVMIVA
ncbi:MAG: hypothetical protein VX066_08510, partial [Pseudomonadota bacterium]|nr:hypothetical protein [Pseudomonadota bacterium]